MGVDNCQVLCAQTGVFLLQIMAYTFTIITTNSIWKSNCDADYSVDS